MAIVKATYTKIGKSAKASIRYIAYRPGQHGQRLTRTLFGSDGPLTRQEAYQLIDAAAKGSRFFRFVVSPDPKTEDTRQDLGLREMTQATMDTLEERLGKAVAWVGAVHADHTPHRHVHIVAVVPGALQREDLRALREKATTVSLQQRRQRDLAYEAQQSAVAQITSRHAAEWSLGSW